MNSSMCEGGKEKCYTKTFHTEKDTVTLSHYKLSLYNVFKHIHIFLESLNKAFVFVHMHMYSRYTIYQFIGKFRCLTISKRILNVPTFTLPDTQLPTSSHFPLKSYSPLISSENDNILLLSSQALFRRELHQQQACML